MKLIVIDGGLYQILNMHSDESTMTYTLWPVDEKARADYEARGMRRHRKHKRSRNR